MRIFFALFLLLPIRLSAQEAPVPDNTPEYVRPKYIELGAGINISTLRDFATSPLVYTGGAGEVVLGILRKDSVIESGFTLRLSSGIYFSPGNDGIERTSAAVSTVFFNYSRIYRIKALSSERWNFKVGGEIDVTGNLRQNPALLNSGVGFESFQTFFGSVKLTRDISRKSVKQGRFLFFKYKKLPEMRELSFQLNPSILNSTYRNGYAYIGQSGVTGPENPFDEYESAVASGFRIKTALNYTRYLKNGNGIRWSYLWDAYRTGGNLSRFEMSHHMFQLALLFKVK